MMRRWRVEGRKDEGSLVLAMLGVLIMTSVVSVGFATVVTGQKQTRHDQVFAQALTGAESGADQLVAQVRSAPTTASPITLSQQTTATGVTYSGTATYTASSTGSASTGSWLINATGTASESTQTVTRNVQENVTLSSIYGVPLFGDTSLAIGSGSGVNEYDSGATGNATDSSCSVLPDTGVLGLLATTMCQPVNSGTGPAATDGSLTMSGSDLGSFNQVDVDNATPSGGNDPEATGTCVGDATACASSKVITSPQNLSYPPSSSCSSGIGVTGSAVTGSNYLAAGAVYNILGNLTLNAAVTANLGNLAATGVTLCFNSSLFVPSLGAAGVTVPWNSTIQAVLPALEYAPRPPSTLQLIDTATSFGTSTIYIGDGLNPETALSAVIYAPYANCVISGHLDLYGALICGSVTAPQGVTVHYDSELKSLNSSEQTVTVSNWREVH
jgi:hypothetical protein